MAYDYTFNRQWLVAKFSELQKNTLLVLEQLFVDDVNWRPNSYSNSIANLVLHIDGYIKERIEKGILHKPIVRSREDELGATFVTRETLMCIMQERFDFVISTINDISDELLEEVQVVRGKERMNLDMLHQCAAHFSEHVGQIYYITKLRLGGEYKSLTTPIKPVSMK